MNERVSEAVRKGDPEGDPEAASAASALASLRAAVRQRQSELAAAGGGGADELAASLAELRRREFVQEPQPVSPRPGIGALIVLARKAFYHLFAKWHARAVLQQQNEFNQSVASLVAALAERERARHAELGRLARRLDELEERLDSARSAPGAASRPGPLG